MYKKTDLYNSMAYIVNHLLNLPDYAVSDYVVLDNKWRNRALETISQRFPRLFDEYNHVRKLRISQTESDYFYSAVCLFCKECEDPHELLFLLEMMDDAVENIIYSGLISDNENYREMSALNDNSESIGISILPNVKCFWKRKSNGSQHGYEILHALQNTYYIIKRNIGKLELHHLIFDSTLFFELNRRHQLRIACSGITDQVTVNGISFYQEHDRNVFIVDSIDNQDIIKNNVLKALDKSCQEDIDILVFPEMLGSHDLYEKIVDITQKNIGCRYPPIVILPSIWEEKRNTAGILIGNESLIIYQDKQHSVVIEHNGQKYKEYITPNYLLYVLHIPLLGRICIMLCKDFLVSEYLDIILKEIRASLIIVPSFSSGSYDFRNTVDACKKYDCDVVWINTCSAKHLGNARDDSFDVICKVLKSGYNSGVVDEKPNMRDCQNCHEDICFFVSTINMSYRRRECNG